jgi:hypothetical protein
MERAGGVPRDSVEGLGQSARAAGLEVVEANGSFVTADPELGFDLHAITIASADRAIASGTQPEADRRSGD